MRTYVSVTLRNVAYECRHAGMSLCHVCRLRNSENLAGQRSYVILLCKRRVEPGNVCRRPEPSAMVVDKDIVGPSVRQCGYVLLVIYVQADGPHAQP